MYVRIFELIFMEKDKKEFPWFPKLIKKSLFERPDILKTLSHLFTEQKPGFSFEKSLDEASKNNTRYHSNNRELKCI